MSKSNKIYDRNVFVTILFTLVVTILFILLLLPNQHCVNDCLSRQKAKCMVEKNTLERPTSYDDLRDGTEFKDKVYETYWTINLLGNDTRYILRNEWVNYVEGIQKCYSNGEGTPTLNIDKCIMGCI